MNKRLVWFGLGFQLIQFSILVLVGLTLLIVGINWDFITPLRLMFFVLGLLNIGSIFGIIYGLIQK